MNSPPVPCYRVALSLLITIKMKHLGDTLKYSKSFKTVEEITVASVHTFPRDAPFFSPPATHQLCAKDLER